jgi:hypothetical protein
MGVPRIWGWHDQIRLVREALGALHMMVAAILRSLMLVTGDPTAAVTGQTERSLGSVGVYAVGLLAIY